MEKNVERTDWSVRVQLNIHTIGEKISKATIQI